MIRSETEYQQARKTAARDEQVAARQRVVLEQQGLDAAAIAAAIEPLLSAQTRLRDDLAWYEAARSRTLPPVHDLRHIGRLLVALRIANGISQRELAARLGISSAVLSRDERNDYQGISVERAQRILTALGETVKLSLCERST